VPNAHADVIDSERAGSDLTKFETESGLSKGGFRDTDIGLRIENAIGGLRNFGYMVTVEPLPGKEQELYEELRDGLRKIESAIEGYRRHFSVRGTNTKRIRQMLWRDLPEPCWGASAPDDFNEPLGSRRR